MAEINASSIIVKPALGCMFKLGQLFDCRTDSVVSNVASGYKCITEIDPLVQVHESSGFTFIPSDSIHDKARALDMDHELKLSCVSGLVKCFGSGVYWHDRSTYSNQERVTLQYKQTTKVERLKMGELKMHIEQNLEALKSGCGTHIVSGIMYGMQAFLVCERWCFDKSMSRSWHEHVENMPKVDFDGKSQLQKDLPEEMASIKVHYHGDTVVPTLPATYTEAVHFCKVLPSLLKTDPEKAIPILVYLYPLNNIPSGMNKIVSEIPASYSSAVEKYFEEIHTADITCNDILSRPVCSHIAHFYQEVTDCKKMIRLYREEFQNQLAKTVPKIRNGELEEKELAAILEARQKSPFQNGELSVWLNTKQQEVKIVQNCASSIPDIKFATRPGDLEDICMDLTHKYIVCLMIRRHRYNPLHVAMESYLGHAISPRNQGQPMTDMATKRTLLKTGRTLIEIFKANPLDGSTEFVVAEELADKGETGAFVYLYKDGALEDTNFTLQANKSQPSVHPPSKQNTGRSDDLSTSHQAEQGRNPSQATLEEPRCFPTNAFPDRALLQRDFSSVTTSQGNFIHITQGKVEDTLIGLDTQQGIHDSSVVSASLLQIPEQKANRCDQTSSLISVDNKQSVPQDPTVVPSHLVMAKSMMSEMPIPNTEKSNISLLNSAATIQTSVPNVSLIHVAGSQAQVFNEEHHKKDISLLQPVKIVTQGGHQVDDNDQNAANTSQTFQPTLVNYSGMDNPTAQLKDEKYGGVQKGTVNVASLEGRHECLRSDLMNLNIGQDPNDRLQHFGQNQSANLHMTGSMQSQRINTNLPSTNISNISDARMGSGCHPRIPDSSIQATSTLQSLEQNVSRYDQPLSSANTAHSTANTAKSISQDVHSIWSNQDVPKPKGQMQIPLTGKSDIGPMSSAEPMHQIILDINRYEGTQHHPAHTNQMVHQPSTNYMSMDKQFKDDRQRSMQRGSPVAAGTPVAAADKNPYAPPLIDTRGSMQSRTATAYDDRYAHPIPDTGRVGQPSSPSSRQEPNKDLDTSQRLHRQMGGAGGAHADQASIPHRNYADERSQIDQQKHQYIRNVESANNPAENLSYQRGANKILPGQMNVQRSMQMNPNTIPRTDEYDRSQYAEHMADVQRDYYPSTGYAPDTARSYQSNEQRYGPRGRSVPHSELTDNQREKEKQAFAGQRMVGTQQMHGRSKGHFQELVKGREDPEDNNSDIPKPKRPPRSRLQANPQRRNDPQSQFHPHNVSSQGHADSSRDNSCTDSDEEYHSAGQAGLSNDDFGPSFNSSSSDSSAMSDVSTSTSQHMLKASRRKKVGNKPATDRARAVHEEYVPSDPRNVKSVSVTHDSITLTWKEPHFGSQMVSQYEICCEAQKMLPRYIYTGKKTEKFKVGDLLAGTMYRFKVRACTEKGFGNYSEDTRAISTCPTSPPGKPKISKRSVLEAEVEWTAPKIVGYNTEIESYIVHACIGNDDWFTMKNDMGNDTSVFVDIQPNKNYRFKIAADCGESGKGEESQESEIFCSVAGGIDLLKATMKGKVQLIGTDVKPYQYKMLLKETYKNDASKIKKCELGEERKSTAHPMKVIMLVGATGSGKTTLINGMVNYIFGVNWQDDSRLKLIVEPTEGQKHSQAKSQTSWITAYTIHHQEGLKINYSLTVVDTPGFGDTSGIERDKEITKQIKEFFAKPGSEGIDHIDAVGFVVQASLPRLTATQTYIFDSILSLFGKDIEDNIFMLLTFADGQDPPVLDGLGEAKMPYKMFFKFNNSALFAKNQSSSADSDCAFDAMFWKMGVNSFRTFLDSLAATEPRSLILTKGVLHERSKLEVYIAGLHMDIQTGLNKLEQLSKEVKVLKSHKADINKNKDFEYTVDEEHVELAKIPDGTFTTNCLTCKRTCHLPCGIKDNEGKKNCVAMKDGLCTVCPGKCDWNMHKNLPHKYEIVKKPVKKTAKELKERYEAAQGKKMNVEQLIQKVLAEFETNQVKILAMTESVRLTLMHLNKIALKPNPLSTTEYLDILIQSEKAEAKPGFTQRIAQLQNVRKQAEYMESLAGEGHDPFAEYKKRIEEAKNLYMDETWNEVEECLKRHQSIQEDVVIMQRPLPTPEDIDTYIGIEMSKGLAASKDRIKELTEMRAEVESWQKLQDKDLNIHEEIKKKLAQEKKAKKEGKWSKFLRLINPIEWFK